MLSAVVRNKIRYEKRIHKWPIPRMDDWGLDKVAAALEDGDLPSSDSDKSASDAGDACDKLIRRSADKNKIADQPLSENFLLKVFDAVAMQRRHLYADMPATHKQNDFWVDLRATEDTWERKKLPSDGVRVEAYSADARALCDKFMVQRSWTFTTELKFDHSQACRLCLLFAHKLQFFLDLWRLYGRPHDMLFNRSDIIEYKPSDRDVAWIQNLEVDDPVRSRLPQFYALEPKSKFIHEGQ